MAVDRETREETAGAAGPPVYARDAAEVVAALGPTRHPGLTAAEAAERLASQRPNAIEGEKPPSVWAVAVQQLRDPMNIMLIRSPWSASSSAELSTSVAVRAAHSPQRRARVQAGADREGQYRRAVEDAGAPGQGRARRRVDARPGRGPRPGDLVQVEAGDLFPPTGGSCVPRRWRYRGRADGKARRSRRRRRARRD